MRSAKSISSIPANGDLQPNHFASATIRTSQSKNSSTSPICRCRVMYLGSSVPHITKDGLQGIQEPLRELYPDKATLASGNAGIDSWLSVWSNGILIENIDENGREMKRFFRIDALHYCAAVKFVPETFGIPNQVNGQYATLSNGQPSNMPRFLPLDSPHARQINTNPPIFASILRRTTGIKVLECHAFICKREAAANALVRCCFHAYADTMYAKQIGADVNNISSNQASNVDEHDASARDRTSQNSSSMDDANQPMVSRRSKSIAALNESDTNHAESWRSDNSERNQDVRSEYDRISVNRRRGVRDTCDPNDNHQHQQQMIANDVLRNQQKLSKSMHQLNQGGIIYHQAHKVSRPNDFDGGQSTSASCITGQTNHLLYQPTQQPLFSDTRASRVPSYPPQNIIDASNNGGTMRSIKSMAANSIASTLLRSKKHAKAMSKSMAQLDQDTSFHRPFLNANANTLNAPMLMPPVPTMFLPHLQNRPILNGSQTMKLPSRPFVPIVGPPANFETMTPKEIKKILKKNAKYNLNQKFCENGPPIMPLRPPLPQLSQHLPSHLAQHNGSGSMISQSMYSDICNSNMMNMATMNGLPGPPIPHEMLDPNQDVRPILVKPNAEFLKSKAGKKWIKQQKEFKKLLPPHLDGLPIIFGPPPPDALEPVSVPDDIPPNGYIGSPLPVMDSSGYYNPNQIYSQNGRASAASTLLRYSPHSQMLYEAGMGQHISPHLEMEYMHQNPMAHSNGVAQVAPNMRYARGGGYVNDTASMIYSGDRGNINQYELGFRQQQKPQNHMVEQSVISLGDENEYDDEEGPSNGFYEPEHNALYAKRSISTGSSNTHNNQHETERFATSSQNYDMNYSNDDQSSYSSGVYKRGCHMNERAFSYSIQQEHKSGANSSDAEYANQSEVMLDSALHQQNYQSLNNNQHQPNKMLYGSRQKKDGIYHDRHESQSSAHVNELTARLENQLNMKSFANPRVKSHN